MVTSTFRLHKGDKLRFISLRWLDYLKAICRMHCSLLETIQSVAVVRFRFLYTSFSSPNYSVKENKNDETHWIDLRFVLMVSVDDLSCTCPFFLHAYIPIQNLEVVSKCYFMVLILYVWSHTDWITKLWKENGFFHIQTFWLVRFAMIIRAEIIFCQEEKE